MYEQHNDSFRDITDSELEKALTELSIDRKSTHPDELHPVVLKNMGPNMKELLLTLFNRVLEDKVWPFSINEVVFIPKAGTGLFTTDWFFV